MCGVYPNADVLTAGDEISSTYEGRHITMLESELIHPFRAGNMVNKGDPVIITLTGTPASRGHAVGVAFKTATVAGDLIAVDTEGIWNLNVFARDDSGAVDVNPGDPLYIHDGSDAGATDPAALGVGDCAISKIRNLATQIPFGYALGYIASGDADGNIAVKVHWDPRQPFDELHKITDTPVNARGFDFQIDDESVPTGTQTGVRIIYNTSGAGVGNIYTFGLDLSVTATGNTGGNYYAQQISVDPSGLAGVQSSMGGLFIWMGSYAGKAINNYYGISINIHNDGTTTGGQAGIYFRGHGAVVTDTCLMVKTGGITNFVEFTDAAIPVVPGTPTGTTKYYLNVLINNVACGIICDTVA